VLQVAPEPIQPPDHKAIESAPPGIAQQGVQRWSSLLGSTDPLIYVLTLFPAATEAIVPQVSKLVLACLVVRADASVERGSQWEI
jgi:hypothetical protein